MYLDIAEIELYLQINIQQSVNGRPWGWQWVWDCTPLYSLDSDILNQFLRNAFGNWHFFTEVSDISNASDY
jgi:hypothetical protein